MFKTKLTLILLIALICLSTNCTEAPVNYDSIEPAGYKVYFYDNGDNPKWYTYYPEEDILDSVNLPMHDDRQYGRLGWGPYISPAGDRMYIHRNSSCEIVVVDVKEKTLLPGLSEVCGFLWISFSPGGGRMIVSDPRWSILNYEDHEILASNWTASLWYPSFSADGNFVYGTEAIDGNTYLSVYDVNDSSLVSRNSLSHHNLNAIYGRTHATADLSSWYTYTTLGNPKYFFEWNAETDSILYIDTVPNTLMDAVMRVSNDGRYVAYNSYVSSSHPLETRPFEIKIYDTQLHQLADIIDTRYVNEAGDTTYYAVVEMVITPDSKYLVGISNDDEPLFLVYNLETLEIERWVELTGYHSFRSLLCKRDL